MIVEKNKKLRGHSRKGDVFWKGVSIRPGMSDGPICPICGKLFTKFSIIAHVEACLSKSNEPIVGDTRAKQKKTNTSNEPQQPIHQHGPNRVLDLSFGVEPIPDASLSRAVKAAPPSTATISSAVINEREFITDFSKV
jgi:hypothetical protein